MFDMENKIKISVIIPAYNVEKYIGNTIESTLMQSFEDYEVVVVDDGSKDNTGIIIDRIAANNTKVKAIHQENGGVMAARMKGIENSHGDWITFLDGDDMLPQTSLATLYKHISDEIDIIWGIRAYVDEKNRFINKESSWFEGKIEKDRYQDIICRHPKSLHGMLYRRSLFQTSIVIERTIVNNEDQLFNLFLSPQVRYVFGTNEIVHHYLMRQDSVSKQKYNADYWYHMITYVANNYKKYGLESVYYERYILTRICCLIRIEGNINFDYNHPCFNNLKKLCYSNRRSVYENLTIFLLRHHNRFFVFLSRIHPSKIIRR